jgi:hypothetical protein
MGLLILLLLYLTKNITGLGVLVIVVVSMLNAR